MSLFNKFLLILLSVVLAVAIVFLPELSEAWTTTVDGAINDSVRSVQLPIDQSRRITGFRLGQSVGSSRKVFVSDLRSKKDSRGVTMISFDLSGVAANEEFPSLRLFLLDDADKAVRVLTYSNTQYTHVSQAGRNITSLSVGLRANERGFTVEAFYGH